MLDKNVWPPEQPNDFTPLLLIQYQGQKTSEQDIPLRNLIHTDNIGKIASTNTTIMHHPKLEEMSNSRGVDLKTGYHTSLEGLGDANIITKEVTTILSPFERSDEPCFILIEGPPGIGKSLLLKEIAYRWGKKQALKIFKLVLLVCLRYPFLQHAKSIKELIECFCEGDTKATEIATACSDYFLENGGKDLLFLFDGFDELPEELQNDGLIEKIMKRELLPNCGLIVSTRSHVSAYQRKWATYKVDILGFAEVERNAYIQNAFKSQPEKIEELATYLDHHTTISSLCFVPFNMVVLLYLYKQGILPKNYVDLYNYFICLTICNHLAKYGHSLTNTITDITNLPEPYNKVIRQLSKFSLEALNNQKLVFTLDEIKAACPDIADIPEAINGFGLLQAVQKFDLTGTTMNFYFVHYSVQEFLAAHYIAHLPQRDQLQALHEINRNIDILFLYIAIKGKKGFSCKLFLSGGNREKTISEEFLTDQLQCLRLYQRFHEIGEKTICASIEQTYVFNNEKINLRRIKLTAYDMECIVLFIMSSFHKEWNELCLDSCYVQDHGICILRRISNVTVTSLNLDNNGLTVSSSSIISDVVINCRVERLSIAGNSTIGEDNLLYSMLSSPFSILKELYMQRTNLSSNAAKCLFAAIQTKTRLQVLNIMNNSISDDACNAITDAIKRNTSLTTLKMQRNPISQHSAFNILRALEQNNTLMVLGLPEYSKEIQSKIKSLQELINQKRQIVLREIKYS